MMFRKALILLTLPVALGGCLTALQPKPISNGVMVGPGERLLAAALPAFGAQSPFKRVADNGERTTWLSPDSISLTFDRGILVASRGLGQDLMGASASPTLAAMASPPEAPYRRQLRYLSGDNQSTWLYAACEMTAAGMDRGFTRFEEQCRTHTQAFTNLYWRAANGEIVQSEQWISPQLGMVRLRYVENL